MRNGWIYKISSGLACVCLMALLASACGDDDGACTCPADDVINCGHRGTGTNGSSNDYPENTIPSFEQAVLEGADMVELDVQHTSDGELVVIHDDTVDRTTDASGCVQDFTLAELQQLDAAMGTSLEGTGVVLPTLADVFDAVDVPINVEIKINEEAGCPDSDRAALAADVVAVLQADPLGRMNVVSSFDLDVLLEVQTLDSSIPLGYLTLVPSDADVAAQNGFAALNVLGGLLNQGDVDGIHDEGLEVNVWTVNDGGKMEELFGYGVSMIITDEPDVFEERREAFCAVWCGSVD